MIKKSVVAIAVIVAAAALVFAATGSADHTNSINKEKQQTLSASSGTFGGSASGTGSQTKISSSEAKKIAQKYIEQPGATAGTPALCKTGGKYVYVVPVIDDGKTVGEIDIDAQNGKNVGGAGGAP